MTRPLPAALAAAVTLMAATPLVAQAPDFPTPKTFPPDEATLKAIKEKTAELKKTLDASQRLTGVQPWYRVDRQASIYLKAAEWIVRHGEWYTEKSGQQTLEVLDSGLARMKAMADDKLPWLEGTGVPIVLGYRSRVDGSIQPYSVKLPTEFDRKKKYRLDVILHGRDATLTEVKFIHARLNAKPGKIDHIELEVYGRGNNAYRWAGEADVFEAIKALKETFGSVDERRVVLRGFSMGGAGTWHLGLHHPFEFAVIGPGAGFTTTRGYVGNLPRELPDYVEKCLHIYDAVDYAENAFNVPVVAYSGEKDKQKAAADNIEKALKDFKEPHSFTHLIAPGLEHQMPKEWQAKAEDEYAKHLKDGRPEVPERVRFVTYTPSHMGMRSDPSGTWAVPLAQQRQYEKTLLDGTYKTGAITLTTENVRVLLMVLNRESKLTACTIDKQSIPLKDGHPPDVLRKDNGKWKETTESVDTLRRAMKMTPNQGPIDDAFSRAFVVVGTSAAGFAPGTAALAAARQHEFAANWDRYFRGELPTLDAARVIGDERLKVVLDKNLVLFGDPQSNPAIAKVLPKLPITWTKDELVVNEVKYDTATHIPVLIYPDPEGYGYVVLNSGHTFREADLKGTNALLYPRLGDWAVLKAKPTKDDPAGFEVVAAGLFDENWQFPKKK